MTRSANAYSHSDSDLSEACDYKGAHRMFGRIASAVSRRWTNSSPTESETMRETMDNAVAKASQIDLASDMVFLEDLREIGEQERCAVDEYRKKKLGLKGCQPKGEKVGDRNMILCDNYQHGIGPVAMAILCGAVGLPTVVGGAALLYSLLGRGDTAPTPQQPERRATTDTWTEYTVEPWSPTEEEKARAEANALRR